MRKFRKNQTVYFYKQTGQFIGEIVTGKITGAQKDLLSGKVFYEVTVEPTFIDWYCREKETLQADYLYTNKKVIEKEHKDEIVYHYLNTRISELDKTFAKIISEYAEKIELKPTSWCTLDVNKNGGIIVDGIGNLQDEFNKLKKEVASIKKKIKKPTKKTVVKEVKEKEAPKAAEIVLDTK